MWAGSMVSPSKTTQMSLSLLATSSLLFALNTRAFHMCTLSASTNNPAKNVTIVQSGHFLGSPNNLCRSIFAVRCDSRVQSERFAAVFSSLTKQIMAQQCAVLGQSIDCPSNPCESNRGGRRPTRAKHAHTTTYSSLSAVNSPIVSGIVPVNRFWLKLL